MARVSDEERQKVAARLRDSAEERMAVKGKGTGNNWSWLYRSIFGHCMGGNKGANERYVEVAHRLADLIDPPAQCPHYHSDRHYCSVHEDMQEIDRDALLELAEDVRGYCIERQITPWVAGRIYDRIREALGVDS